MLARTFPGLLVILFFVAQAGIAGSGGDVSSYFNKTAIEVKAANSPAQKRAILEHSIGTMSKALKTIEQTGLVSVSDRTAAKRLQETLQEKHDELKGNNAFEGVADNQLNAFAEYVVQDMEQADQYVTVSLVTILLLIIILILIL